MKKLIFILAFVSFSNKVFSQNISVNTNNPIEGIDLIYSGNLTRLQVNLNELNQSFTTELSQTKLPVKISVEGSIIWSKSQNDETRMKIRDVELRPLSADRPYLFFADLYDLSNNLLERSTISNNWQKIILKVKYNINGEQKELPNISMYPPRDVATNMQSNLKFLTPIFLTDDKEIEIGIEETNKQAIEIRELKLISNNGNRVDPISIDSSRPDVSSQNGNIKLKINLDSSPDVNSNHRIEATIHYLNTQVDDQTIGKDFNFVKKYDLKIIDSTYKVKVPFEQNTVNIQNIETKGIGTLSVRFLDQTYSSKIEPQSLNISNDGLKSFSLEGFSGVEYGTGSTFYFTSNGKEIGNPNYIYKALPKVENFMFNGVDDNYIKIKVVLDEPINEEKMVMKLIYMDKALSTSDKGFINKSIGNNREYSILIQKDISNFLNSDSIYFDVKFQLEASSEKIYAFTSTLFNQKKLDEKLNILISESEKSKNDRNKVIIKNTLEEIQRIAIHAGNSVRNEEVATALNVLESGSKEKTIKTIEDIGKWVLIVGKIFLPIL